MREPRVKYIRCKEGMKYTLTKVGFEDSRIRAKFEPGSRMSKTYAHSVPSAWIEKGYVMEVKE